MPGPVVSYILAVERKAAQREEMGRLSEAESLILRRLNVRPVYPATTPLHVAAFLPLFINIPWALVTKESVHCAGVRVVKLCLDSVRLTLAAGRWCDACFGF